MMRPEIIYVISIIMTISLSFFVPKKLCEPMLITAGVFCLVPLFNTILAFLLTLNFIMVLIQGQGKCFSHDYQDSGYLEEKCSKCGTEIKVIPPHYLISLAFFLRHCDPHLSLIKYKKGRTL